MNTFVIWDMQTRDLRLMLEFLPDQEFVVPGLKQRGGDLAWRVLEDGIKNADRIVAFLDLPNANVGFELGFALGCQGKPVALLRSRVDPRRGWETHPPLNGLLSTPISTYEDLLRLPDRAFFTGPGWRSGGEQTLFLCPGGGPSGSAIRCAARRDHPGWTYLPDQGWNLLNLPQHLNRVGTVVWVITDYAEGADVRDGAENACSSVVAGFALARGADLIVLRHDAARRVVDVESREKTFSARDELQSLLLAASGRGGTQAPPTTTSRLGGRLDFSAYMKEKLQNFVGRQWLTDRADAFLREQDRGYIILDALPGMGKSTFAASLVRRAGWPHHFNARALGVVSYEQFLRSVWAQFTQQYGLSIPAPSVADLTHGLYFQSFLECVGRAAVERGERAVLIIDAIDEARGTPEGAQPLFLPTALPSGVRILVTLRAVGRPMLLTDEPTLHLGIDPTAPENREDIEAFLRQMAAATLLPLLQRDRLSPEDFVRTTADASEGNFMYVRAVVNDLLSNNRAVSSARDLPRGLVNYYERHWQQIRADCSAAQWERRLLPVLCVFAVTEKPLTLRELQAILTFAFPEVADLPITEIRDIVDRWAQFLIREPGPDGPRFQIYHRSFQEFLRGKDEVGGELASREAHRWISDTLLREFRERVKPSC